MNPYDMFQQPQQQQLSAQQLGQLQVSPEQLAELEEQLKANNQKQNRPQALHTTGLGGLFGAIGDTVGAVGSSLKEKDLRNERAKIVGTQAQYGGQQGFQNNQSSAEMQRALAAYLMGGGQQQQQQPMPQMSGSPLGLDYSGLR